MYHTPNITHLLSTHQTTQLLTQSSAVPSWGSLARLWRKGCNCASEKLEHILSKKNYVSNNRNAWKVYSYIICAHAFSCVWLLKTPWTVACQTPLSIGFPRQEYRSGLPFPSSGDLPDPGIKPTSPEFAGWFFTSWATGEVIIYISI